MFRAVADAIFPRSCAGCATGPWPFCRDCAAALVPLQPPWCVRCGRPSERDVPSCLDCPPGVDTARAAFLFEGPARRAIHRLKFAGWRPVADALAAAIVATGPPEAEVVTWVPLAPGRLASRGYDQARALAGAVAARTGLPVRACLQRVLDPGPQARRVGAARRTAMRGAFRPIGRACSGSVLLVDDVLTTGATAAACAEAIRDGGAHRVALVTAARAFSVHRPPRYTRSTVPRLGLWLPGDPPR